MPPIDLAVRIVIGSPLKYEWLFLVEVDHGLADSAIPTFDREEILPLT